METTTNNDRRTYTWAAATLRFGMLCSFGVMVVGLVWWLLAGAPGGESSASTTIPLDRILPELLAVNALALLNLGVLLLLATPGVTMLAIIAGYAADRNRRFVAIGALVVAILALSLVLAFS